METVLSINEVIDIVKVTIGCILGFVIGIGILIAYQVYMSDCFPVLIIGVLVLIAASVVSTVLTCYLLSMKRKSHC